MRFRKPTWDIDMSPALVAYWTAWNENDQAKVSELLAGAVTDDVVWNDPRHTFSGIGALAAAIDELRSAKPDYRFVIASEIDAHHSRLRYRWDMTRGDRTLMEGLDIVTLNHGGLIQRVDGFFGQPTPLLGSDSGVPEVLRR